MELLRRDVYKNNDILETFKFDESRVYLVLTNGRIRFDSSGFIFLEDVKAKKKELRTKMKKFISAYC